MTRKRDRIFAASGAILFLVTASALTIAVVAAGFGDRNKSNDTGNQTATNQSNCEQSAAAEKLAVPEAFKPGSDVTALQVTPLEAGSGPAVKKGDCIEVKYYGTLAKDGTVFDENYDKDTAFQFVIGQGSVIQGWEQGLIGTRAGGSYRLVIPSDLAYGPQSNGTIPANADLVFQVKVLGVK